MAAKDAFADCPCGSGFPYAACCAPFHAGIKKPDTAEQLMRSRYSAFAKGQAKYLVNTRAPAMREATDLVDIKTMIQSTQWIALSIKDTELGQVDDKIGEVEFVASYISNQQPGQLHERSRFIKDGDQWFYLDGDIKA